MFEWPKNFDWRCLEFWTGLGIGLSAAAGVWSYFT